ncbi:MAG: acyl carrier protein [Minicystis sp.]
MMSSNGLETAVSQVVARFARVEPPYAPEAHLYRDLGIESVQVLNLLVAIEAEFAVSLDDRRFIQSGTIDDLAHLIGEAQ